MKQKLFADARAGEYAERKMMAASVGKILCDFVDWLLLLLFWSLTLISFNVCYFALANIAGSVTSSMLFNFSSLIFFPPAGQRSSHEEKVAAISGGNVQDGNSAWLSALLHVLAGKRRDGPHCLPRTTGS